MVAFSTMNAELVEQFVAVTGAGRDVAINLLEACAGNLDMAVGMHIDSGGAGPSGAAGEGSSMSSFNDDGDESDVRAPIPQKTEVLVEEDASKLASWRMRRPRRHAPSVFDGFRNFQTESYHYDESLRGKRPSKKRNLEDLFRPPVDVTYKGTFQNARDTGSAQNKWLLVNVQNVQEFPCQLLNRDVWSNPEARSIIKDSFIFWQVYNDSEEGKRFMQFYKLTQWPYVAIIDPFTGENQIVWNKISDGIVFCDLAKDFLSSCPVPDSSQLPSAAKRQKREPSIVDATEQEQMEAAIQASLAEKAKPSSPQYVLDSDSEADVVEDSDDVETFSDSDDVIVASPPGSSNGVIGTKATSSSTAPTSSKTNSISKSERLKKQLAAPSPSKPSTSSSSSSSSTSLSQPSSSHTASSNSRRHLSRFSPSTSSEVRIVHQDEDSAGPSGTGGASVGNSIWAASPSQQERDSPLDVNIETSLIDMIGCREAEVCTPEICTLDDSPSNSQQGVSGSKDSQEASQGSSQQTSQGQASSGSWKDYWGDPADPISKIMIRFPDNKREQVELPSSSQLRALTEFCSSHGYVADKYELVTNFPRRKLSHMDGSTSLKEAGLYPQETVFVQDV